MGFSKMALGGCILFLLAGCADFVSFPAAAIAPPVGFWFGLWHGMILGFSWVWSLFSDSTAIYAIYNNGGWYDFGYFLGLGGFGAGIFGSSRYGGK